MRLAHLHRGVRVRITLIAVASVATVLSIGGFVLLRVQQTQLLDNLDATLGQRADDLESADVDVGDRPFTFENLAGDDALVQIVDRRGNVIAASANALGLDPIGPMQPQLQYIRTVPDLPVEDDTYRILSRPIRFDGAPATLHIATNTDDVRGVLSQLRGALLAVIPGASAVLGIVVWLLVGRTLRPVESIRRRVAGIDGTDLAARVPRPGTHDEIDRLAQTMNDMLARQEQTIRSQHRFVADASHELRTPIARMRTVIDTCDPDDVSVVDSLGDEVDNLGTLVDDLLHLARADGSDHGLVMRPVDLDDIVFSEIRASGHPPAPVLRATRVSAAHMIGDPSQLRRMVRNLLDNAIRHARTTVTVELEEADDGNVRLVVADDGDGIDLVDAERIFDRFVRLDDARSQARGGTGLGLAIVHDIVRRHHGDVRLDRSPEHGHRGRSARFVVTLPAARDDVR